MGCLRNMWSKENIPLRFEDGATGLMTVFTNSNTQNAPVLVIFPALGVKASYYQNAARHFASHHMHVILVDNRGHGNSSIKPSKNADYGYKEQIETEYPLVLSKARSFFPDSKVIIMGHSLGGQMGSMFAARYSELVDGLILNASCSTYYKGWGPVLGTGLYVFAWFVFLLSKLLGYYPGNRIGFGGVEAKGVMKDWFNTAIHGTFIAGGSTYNYDAAMETYAKPVLGISYEGDSSSPPLALKNLMDKFSSAKKEICHLKETSDKKYNHYTWAREPKVVLPVIQSWIEHNF